MGSEDISHKLALSRENFPCALRCEKSPDDAHEKDDHRQEHQHLGRFVDEKLQRRRKVGALFQRQHLISEPSGKGGEIPVNQPPRHHANDDR